MNAQKLTTGDKARLSAQCAAILARLRRGSATNVELAEISLKYTSRISDLRAAGIAVECERGTGGLNAYRLTPPPVLGQQELF